MVVKYKYLHDVLDQRSPSGELVGLLTYSFFTICFLLACCDLLHYKNAVN